MSPHAGERGSVMVIALVILSLVMTMGIAMTTRVNSQQRESHKVRTRESALNLAEGVLETQAFALSSTWSQKPTQTFAQCTSAATTQVTACPNKASLASTYPGKEYATATWTSDVFDNSSTEGGNAMQSFYSDSVAANAPRYDANGDNQMWVKASAIVQGRKRSIVALIKRQQNPVENFPFATVTADHLGTSNNGNKTILDLQDGRGQTGPVRLRCANLNSSSCLDARSGQIEPAGQVFGGYTGGDALNAAAIGRLKATAKADGTYYTTAPPNPSGRVVYVENCNPCVYNNSSGAAYNSPSSPGIFIFAKGTFVMNGNSTYYGVIYGLNKQNSSGDVVTLGGTSAVAGAIAVDGPGGVTGGSSKDNIVYDSNATSSIRSYGTTGVVQNTWREIK